MLRRPLTYVVTPKGGLRSTGSVRTFRLHALWAVAATLLLGYSVLVDGDHPALRVWTGLALVTGVTPPLAAAVAHAGRAARRRGNTGRRRCD